MLLVGLIGALLIVAGVRALLVGARGGCGRGAGAGCLFAVPMVAYGLQEFVERLLRAESYPFQAVFEPHFLLGFLVQLPFAALAFLLGWLLFRVGKRLVELLGKRPVPQLHTPSPRLWLPTAVAPPRVRPLSRGHPLRGPPLLVS